MTSQLIGFGTANITTASTTRYLQLGGQVSTTNFNFDGNVDCVAAVAGTMSGLKVYVASNARTTNTTIRFRKNGANANQSVIVPPGSVGWHVATGTDTVAPGDRFTCGVVTLTGSQAMTITTTAVNFDPTAYGQTAVYGGAPGGTSPAAGQFIPIGGFLYSSSTESTVAWPADDDTRVVAAAVRVAGPPGSNTTLALCRNGVDTGLTITIPAGQTGSFYGTGSVDVAFNDLLSFRVASGGGAQITTLGVVFDRWSYSSSQRLGFDSEPVIGDTISLNPLNSITWAPYAPTIIDSVAHYVIADPLDENSLAGFLLVSGPTIEVPAEAIGLDFASMIPTEGLYLLSGGIVSDGSGRTGEFEALAGPIMAAGSGPAPVTGTLTATAPKPNFSASGTQTPPARIGAIAVVAPKPGLLASGSHLTPISGSLAVSAPKPAFTAAGTFTAPTITGSLSIQAPKPSLSASGLHIAPVSGVLSVSAAAPTISVQARHGVAGTVVFCIAAPSFTAEGTATPPETTGVIAITAPKPASVATGVHGARGSIAVQAGPPSFSADGSASPPSVSGEIVISAPKPSLALEAFHLAPSGGVIAVTAPRPAFVSTAVHGVAGTVPVQAPKPSLSIAALHGVRGPVSIQAPSPVLEADGRHGVRGVIAVSSPAPSLAADGTFLSGESYVGEIDVVAPRPNMIAQGIALAADEIIAGMIEVGGEAREAAIAAESRSIGLTTEPRALSPAGEPRPINILKEPRAVAVT